MFWKSEFFRFKNGNTGRNITQHPKLGLNQLSQIKLHSSKKTSEYEIDGKKTNNFQVNVGQVLLRNRL